jgi:hypothetical protein
MKKAILVTLTFAALLIGHFAFAQQQQGYTMLAPIQAGEAGQEIRDAAARGDVAQFANGVIKLTVGFAAVLAVIMFFIGGFQYMTGESLNMKGEGKSKMQNAVLGLVLVLASFVILNTINPQLVTLRLAFSPGSGGGNNNGQQGGIQNPPQGPAEGNFCYISNSGPNRGERICYQTQTQCNNAAQDAGVTGGCFTRAPVGSQAHEEALCSFTNEGVQVSSTAGSCGTCGAPQQCATSLDGVKESTIKGILKLKDGCPGCSMVITGGTEGSHAEGEYSHGNGYKIDIDSADMTSSPFDQYLISLGANPGGGFQAIEGSNGYTYIFHAEPGAASHWDIQVCPSSNTQCINSQNPTF